MNKEFLDLAEQLKSSVSCTVRLNELMSGHTSFKIGGPADILVLPESIEQLRGSFESGQGKLLFLLLYLAMDQMF